LGFFFCFFFFFFFFFEVYINVYSIYMAFFFHPYKIS